VSKSCKCAGRRAKFIPLNPIAIGLIYFPLYPLEIGIRLFGTRLWQMENRNAYLMEENRIK